MPDGGPEVRSGRRTAAAAAVMTLLVAAFTSVAWREGAGEPSFVLRTEDVIIPRGFPADQPPALPDLAAAPAVAPEHATLLGIHDLTGCDGQCGPTSHWGRYRWANAVAPVRAFWLVDRTGDARANAALREFVERWNRDMDGRQGPGQDIPYIGYYRDDAYVGQCSPNPWRAEGWYLPGYSLLLVCNQRVGSLGVALVVPEGPHWGTFVLPWVAVDVHDRSCGGTGLSHAQLVAAFSHEIGHVTGLDHRRGVTVMNTDGSGLCAGMWYDSHDSDAIGAIYQHWGD